MIKLSGSLFFFILSFFYYWLMILLDNGVTATINIPDNIKPGETVTAEVIINKGNVGGFAKLQIEVGNGLSIIEEDSKGAAFSFSGNTAKWIWTALPIEAEFKVKFKVTANASASGNSSIQGKFSYIVNNAKKVAEIPSKNISISDKPSAQITQTPVPTEQSTVNVSPTENNSVTISTSTNVNVSVETSTNQINNENVNQQTAPITNIILNRNIQNINSNTWKITINIKKGSIKGFARYEDVLPEGLNAKAEEKDGSSFFIDNNTIKFVWSSLPEKETLVISYILSGTIQLPVTLNGNFSYTEDNQVKSQSLTPEIIQPSASVSQQPVIQKETKTNIAEESTKAKQVGVFFSVQLGAFQRSKVRASYFTRKYNISGIQQENHESYKKFYSGNFNEYKQARDYREEIKMKGIQDAFVIAHNNNIRITVQEALMITNQKWYP